MIMDRKSSVCNVWTAFITFKQQFNVHVVTWEPKWRHQYWKMFCWEPEGCYHHGICTAIAPFWFSTEHLSWILIVPFWLSTDDVQTFECIHVYQKPFGVWAHKWHMYFNPFSTTPHQNVVSYNNSWLGFLEILNYSMYQKKE